jgi:tRNA modification GTPase
LINKIDKKEKREKREYYLRLGRNAVEISLKKRINLSRMIDEIGERIKKIKKHYEIPQFVINSRQKKITEKIYENIIMALEEWERKEIASYYLKECLINVEAIFGTNEKEEIMNEIFDNFCIGK